MSGTVYVVHCIDTEGPLHESLEATFGRLKAIFGLDLEPSSSVLKALQNRDLDLGGIEDEVARIVAPDLLNYNDTWAKIDAMLDTMMSPQFRGQHPDSKGGSWVYSWFCMDHVGFCNNPRRRDLGYHKVFDHYRDKIAATRAQDGLYFHFHPLALNHEATAAATRYFDEKGRLVENLARRIIDRRSFPSCYRPGFHSERPDAHWFLEQYIPFDYANQSMIAEDSDTQKDISGGRFGDWRRAPKSWVPYHPSHDDHQVPGDCRRWIFRCLNVGTRLRLLSQADVDQAFHTAADGQDVVLSFANHDWRDMAPDVTRVMALLKNASASFPDIEFVYANALDAARGALDIEAGEPISFKLSITNETLGVRSNKPTFGPQPFLAIKTKSGAYHHDNFDFQEPFRRWTYALDDQTIPVDMVDQIGVAGCDAAGNVSVCLLDPATGKQETITP